MSKKQWKRDYELSISEASFERMSPSRKRPRKKPFNIQSKKGKVVNYDVKVSVANVAY